MAKRKNIMSPFPIHGIVPKLTSHSLIHSGVNGVLNATAIPSQLNIAASFSRDLAYIAGAVAGSEARLLNACKCFQ
jgi:beta-glucosidase-like glycosyl hydrolase